jgi:acetyl-CoA carboxylase biotin carboxyl carrier protein
MISDEPDSFITVIPIEAIHDNAECITIDQLRHLVRLIDQSDTQELEVKHGDKKARLVLRKSKPLVSAAAQIEIISIVEEAASPAEQPQHTITASFVGIFQSRSRTQDKALVTVGDIIKAGQHVGAIRLLDIPNEVVSSVTGRVVELLVQDGQIVEFGQPLMMIDKQ